MLLRELAKLSLTLASVIPCLLVAGVPFASRRAPLRIASIVTPLTLALAMLAVVLHALFGRGGDELGDSKVGSLLHGRVQLDLVSSAMLLLVSTLALVVVRYSRTYLAGESGLVRYERSLLLTLAAVTMLVISNDLALLVGGWLLTGIGLHQLLTFYRTRRQAVIVAHKSFLLSQIANSCFFASIVLVQYEVGSLQIDKVNAFAQAQASLSPSLQIATVLIAIGVLLKSAQLPFHGWILQVMEAPTPVSALLHAGVVNIGGFVMIRLAPLMSRAPVAQGVLLTIGLVTAILASLVMMSRESIKVVLAWSTIAQMGFMLVQCGLGAYHLALLHLLAHSLYKAHAFLSTGSVVETWRGASLLKAPKPSFGYALLSVLIVCLVAAPFYGVYRMSHLHAPMSLGPLVLALGLSFVPMLGKAIAAGRRAFRLTALFTVGATVSYFAWHVFFELVAPTSDPETAASSTRWKIVVGGLVVLFVAQTILQTSPSGRLARFLRPHMISGLYIDDWFTRLTFRLWPPRFERAAATSRRMSLRPPQDAS